MSEYVQLIIKNSLFLTYMGAICGHILSLYGKDFSGTMPFLQKLVPNRSDTFYFRIDFIILPIIGTLLAFMLLDPNNVKSSLFAGLSWSGTMTALLKTGHRIG
jgi:hypothetical protein